ncbi:flavocytochrome c [Proteiniclasticum sp.]|uniref:flavocytochrome c n=1 Tax=Proteiniclasticum sp. TaxID=2053595 RepID=UPI00289F8F97|nr:flavocytochrome c [Proteiniclasticum sp.]
MWKKKIAAALMLVLMLAGSGCGSKNETAPETPAQGGTEKLYTAGEYTATGEGNYGEIPVTVTFSETEILSIVVGDNEETPDIAKPVFEKIPDEILTGQTLHVDVVAGATNSSKGLLAAIEACVEKAGGDVEALKNKVVEVGEKEAIEKTADVVIIGGGGAGAAAAASAAENGASVILVEKGSSLGGNTVRAGGAYNAVDEERQSAVEMNDALINDLKSILEVDENKFGDFKDTVVTLKEQIRKYFAEGDTTKLFDSEELHMYQIYIGGKRKDKNGEEITSTYTLAKKLTGQALDALNWLVSKDKTIKINDGIGTVLGAMWPRTHGLSTSVGVGFINPLAEDAKKNGAEFMLETKAEELIIENGRVVGVKAVKTDGTKVTLHAAKGVIMATGGFGANAKMVAQYNTYWPTIPEDMKSTNTSNATGDGINMGISAGANLVGMGFAQLMPSSHPETGALSGGVWGSAESQVFINKEGTRFVNEYAERDTLASAALKQTDSLFYIICDQVTAGDPQPGAKNGWGDVIDDLVETKSIYRADTLEELAEEMGVPADTLVAEIEKYNTFIDNQKDPEFGKTNFGPKIEVAPFYATPRSPSLHHTMGGLQINDEAQVLDKNGKAIPGFYAAGEVTGGIHAGNRLGGNALTDILVFGRIAGKNAATEK